MIWARSTVWKPPKIIRIQWRGHPWLGAYSSYKITGSGGARPDLSLKGLLTGPGGWWLLSPPYSRRIIVVVDQYWLPKKLMPRDGCFFSSQPVLDMGGDIEFIGDGRCDPSIQVDIVLDQAVFSGQRLVTRSSRTVFLGRTGGLVGITGLYRDHRPVPRSKRARFPKVGFQLDRAEDLRIDLRFTLRFDLWGDGQLLMNRGIRGIGQPLLPWVVTMRRPYIWS
jgi:hypothetical protein